MNVLIQFNNNTLYFKNPRDIIRCLNPSDIPAAFKHIESALHKGFYVAGFISYETGYYFEECLRENKNYQFPLIYLGVYDEPSQTHPYCVKDSYSFKNMRINIPKKHYYSIIGIIKDYIAQGEVYQITYCIKIKFTFSGNAYSLYQVLLQEQPVPYPAFIETNEFNILSLSPEMFMQKKGSSIVTKPMKGTWPRGTDAVSDEVAYKQFRRDPKNKAENAMITDLLRNDIGRVGINIDVLKAFEITPYNTLYQMTSTVAGSIPVEIPIYELFKALFPSGSVTGAPKIRAMQIIRNIEKEDRKIYTGAIGYITPHRDLFFNIPIRTILIEEKYAEMGIGGGIVWDSTPEGEWDEGMLKSKFLKSVHSSKFMVRSNGICVT